MLCWRSVNCLFQQHLILFKELGQCLTEHKSHVDYSITLKLYEALQEIFLEDYLGLCWILRTTLNHTLAHNYESLPHRVLPWLLKCAHFLHELGNQLWFSTERFGDRVASPRAGFSNVSYLVFAHRKELIDEILFEDIWFNKRCKFADLLSLHFSLAPVFFAWIPGSSYLIHIGFPLIDF